MSRRLPVWILPLCWWCVSATAAHASVSCSEDLASLPAFLFANDAGARTELAYWGRAHFDAALERARTLAAASHSDAACLRALNDYLASWRSAELWISAGPSTRGVLPAAPAAGRSRAPSLRELSARTLLLRIPSFAGEYGFALQQLLRSQRALLAARPDWIIDVRGNHGSEGAEDGAYAVLLPWLMADGRVAIGDEWLATAANRQDQALDCRLREPKSNECRADMAADRQRMQQAAPGTFVAEPPGAAVRYLRVAPLEPQRPARVAVLVDRGCRGSCEQFLLTVRQSFSVKLVGDPSGGAVDYGHVRPHVLPSAQRVLWYATSRSARLPGLSIDATGVQPDVYLPAPPAAGSPGDRGDAQVRRVQGWLEDGWPAERHEGG